MKMSVCIGSLKVGDTVAWEDLRGENRIAEIKRVGKVIVLCKDLSSGSKLTVFGHTLVRVMGGGKA